MKKKPFQMARYLNFAFSFGVTMAASIFLGYFGGKWLDTKLGTEPYLMLVGVLAGVAVSFYSLLQELFFLEQAKTLEEKSNIQRRKDYQGKEPMKDEDGATKP